MQVYHRKYINLKLKFVKNKSYHKKRTTHWYTVTSLLLKPLTQHLINVKNHLTHNLFCSNALIVLVMFLQIISIIQFTTPNSRQTSAFFSIVYLL